MLLLFGECSKSILVHSINLVVVVDGLTFRALPVRLCRSSAIGLV